MERGSPPLHGRKKFQNLLKNSAILGYFLSLSQVFKYFCMEVYITFKFRSDFRHLCIVVFVG